MVYEWLGELEKETISWLNKSATEPRLVKVAPGGEIKLIVELRERFDNPDNRCIIFLPYTRSTDTTLLFRDSKPESIVISEWGKKLKNKLRDKQCGDEEDGVLRLLVVNFAQADLSWPELISSPKFHTNFQGTIKLLVGDSLPYDVVIPAILSGDSCYGKPIWLSNSKVEEGLEILKRVEMTLPCLPRKAEKIFEF